MNESINSIVEVLIFGILFIVVTNVIISFILSFFSKITNIKTVLFYWLSVLVSYLIQGLFQGSPIEISLSFVFSGAPSIVLSKILNDSLNEKTPTLKFLTIISISPLLTYALYKFNTSFTVYSLPIAIALIIPLLIPLSKVLFTQRQKSSTIQKMMGIQYLMAIASVFNFVFFRTESKALIIGFGFAIILYQIMSITLLAFSLEEYSKTEKERLQRQVDEKTHDLTKSNHDLQNALSVKEMLFKVVLHDIANPISAQGMILDLADRNNNHNEIFERLKNLNKNVVNVIHQIKNLKPLNDGRVNLTLKPINIGECFKISKSVFQERLDKKKLNLVIDNKLPENIGIHADQSAFINSVLNNFISNSIKFSCEGQKITLTAKQNDERITIQIIDHGIGIEEADKAKLFNPLHKLTTLGTDGEEGTGHGLSLAKFYVHNFGGYLSLESTSINKDPENHGTVVSIHLKSCSLT